MISLRVVQDLVNERIEEFERQNGKEAAMFYKQGLLDAVILLNSLVALQQQEAVIDINEAFNPYIDNGGIN